MAKNRLEGKVALITGASRGIGAACAKRLAQEGAHVILAARTVGGLEDVDNEIQALGGQATLVPLDLSEQNKIEELSAVIAERFGKLDILVGNAGMLGELSPTWDLTPKIWNTAFDLNVHANWRLIRSFHPLLKASEAGRAMFVTSAITQLDLPFWGAYAASKAALEMMVRTYAAEVANTPIRVNLVDPGIVRTSMRAQAMPGEDPETLITPEEITDVFVELAETGLQKNGETVSAQG